MSNSMEQKTANDLAEKLFGVLLRMEDTEIARALEPYHDTILKEWTALLLTHAPDLVQVMELEYAMESVGAPGHR